jgi:hypothetical protein
MGDAFALTVADVDAIASRVVELLREQPRVGHHVDTTTVATMLGVSGDWVREHAAELGAVRVRDGPKGALLFDLRRVNAALEHRRLERPRSETKRRPGPARRVHGVELLPLPDDPPEPFMSVRAAD